MLLDEFEEKDDYTYYEEVIRHGLELHPGNPDLLVRLCQSLADQSQFESALKMTESIAGTKEQQLDLDKVRLECYFMLGHYDEIDVLLNARKNESYPDYHSELYEHIIDFEINECYITMAEKLLIEARKLYPKNQTFKSQLCTILESQRRFEEAITIIDELIDASPYSYEAWDHKGRLLALDSEFEKAVDAFDFALTCNQIPPREELDIRLLRSWALYMNKSYDKAIESYQEIDLQNRTIRQESVPSLAECYFKTGHTEKGLELFRDYLAEFDKFDQVSTYINYTQCLAGMDLQDEICKQLEAAFDYYPDEELLSCLLIQHYVELHPTDMANIQRMINRLITQLTKNEMLFDEELTLDQLLVTGYQLFKHCGPAQAIHFFNKLIDIYGFTSPDIYLYIAMIYVETDDEANALKYVELAKKCTNPDNNMICVPLGMNDESENVPIDLDDLSEMIRTKFEYNESMRDAMKRKDVSDKLVDDFLKNKDNKN